MFVALTVLAMEFQNLCSFETFQRFWSNYGYEGKMEETIEQEFSRIKGKRMFKGIILQNSTICLCDCSSILTSIYGH